MYWIFGYAHFICFSLMLLIGCAFFRSMALCILLFIGPSTLCAHSKYPERHLKDLPKNWYIVSWLKDICFLLCSVEHIVIYMESKNVDQATALEPSQPALIFVNNICWKIATLISLHIVYDCLCGTSAELSNWDTDRLSRICYWFFEKKSPTPNICQ